MKNPIIANHRNKGLSTTFLTCLLRIFGNTAYVEKKIIPSLKLNEWKSNKCTIMAKHTQKWLEARY